MDYQSILRYLYNLTNMGSKLGLEGIKLLLQQLGNPQKELKAIHIAGTNGKGSVACLCASILEKAGHKVGLFTSPHLLSFRERIMVNNVFIPKERVEHYFHEILPQTQVIKENQDIVITFFEFLTAMAFLHFREEQIDVAVLEVGLGGRLDATNVLDPLVSVITNIALDHTHILGKDILTIASEKAAIIKPDGVLVTTEQHPEVLSFFEEQCKAKNAKMINANQEYVISYPELMEDKQQFTLEYGRHSLAMSSSLWGKHQLQNIKAAFGAMQVVNNKGLSITDDAVREGVENAHWIGRMERVSKKPFVLIDCAHNPAAMQTVADTIQSIKQKQKFTRSILVIGISDKKDKQTMAKTIAPLFDEVLVTEAIHRGTPIKELEACFAKVHHHVVAVPKVQNAVEKAVSYAEKSGLVLICGSLFVVSEALPILIFRVHNRLQTAGVRCSKSILSASSRPRSFLRIGNASETTKREPQIRTRPDFSA